MVEDEPVSHEIVLTPQFLNDLESCVAYVADKLASPLAAKKMYEAIREKVLGLSIMPQAAVNRTSPTTGNVHYMVSYNKYLIYYCIEGTVVRVLGIKHELQNEGWFD